MALGRPVDIAINHDPDAILMHKTNHQDTLHLTEDIFKVNLKKYVKGQHVALMWASPDCTSHSKAKGGKPREKGLRILPWAVYKHAKEILPDVVLMEKHIMCQKEGISLSCMIDGTACDFMENEDVCMLFGNALNNAIEAAGKCVNEKKYISLNVKKENAFTRIYVENYFTGARKVEGGRFCTTKDNELFEHGYGLKSIRILVSKYNGHVTITTEDDLFCLNILFPL